MSKRYLLIADEDWVAEDLRDYCRDKMQELGIAFNEGSAKEMAIFRAHMARYPMNSVRIARYVYETLRGMWQAHGVTPFEFTKAADYRFSDPIVVILCR